MLEFSEPMREESETGALSLQENSSALMPFR